MSRYWPLLLLLLAVGAVLAFLMRNEEEPDPAFDVVADSEPAPYAPPELEGLPAAQREAYRQRQDTAAREREEKRETEAKRPDPHLLVGGRVVAAEDSSGILGALVWWAFPTQPCPRLDAPFYSLVPGEAQGSTGVGEVQVYTDARGAFRLRKRKGDVEVPETLDVFAWAKGRVLRAVCGVAKSDALEIRLEKGLGLKGVVLDPQNRPVATAVVRARPGPETPDGIGHATPAFLFPRTDEEGRFALGGLLADPVLVEADHPDFMPATVGPYSPSEDGGDVRISLVPALRVDFVIRSDDGRVPVNPTVVWTTTEDPPRSQVMLLPGRKADEEAGHVTGGPVRIPCDAPGYVLQVKADGYSTWRSEALGLPEEGGEETFEIKLTGALAAGRLRISFEDDRGERLKAVDADVRVSIGRLDPGAVASAYVVRQQEDLQVTDLPAGRYRIEMLSAAFAPAVAEVEVIAAEETHTQVSVRPPAKLRVKVFGSVGKLVPFEIHREGRRVAFVPDGTYEQRRDEATGQTITVAGPEGLLASGLAAGSCTVIITSDEVYASPTTVGLREGETEEIEIEVRLR